MDASGKFAKRVFQIAGIYGIIVLLPQYFLEGMIGRDTPPPITHPEYFYGFIGVGLTWQVVFLMIATDVKRFRLLMIPAVLEKLSFGLAVIILYLSDRTSASMVGAGGIDLVLGALFVLAFRSTGGESR